MSVLLYCLTGCAVRVARGPVVTVLRNITALSIAAPGHLAVRPRGRFTGPVSQRNDVGTRLPSSPGTQGSADSRRVAWFGSARR